jgi:hypothetical protein
MISLSREDGARKDILKLCTHNPQKKGSSIDVYTTFPWEALCREVAKLVIHRRSPDNLVELRAAVSVATAAGSGSKDPPDDDPFDPPPAPTAPTSTPRNRGLSRSLATPLATPAADSKGIRDLSLWRRRESNPLLWLDQPGGSRSVLATERDRRVFSAAGRGRAGWWVRGRRGLR